MLMGIAEKVFKVRG